MERAIICNRRTHFHVKVNEADDTAMNNMKDSFAIYKNNNSKELVIPNGFMNRWWYMMNSTVELTSSSGVKRLVDIWKNGNSLVLGEKWDEFVEANRILVPIWIVRFKYIEDNKFTVQFFGYDGTEIQLKYNTWKDISTSFCIPYIKLTTTHVTVKIPAEFTAMHGKKLTNPLTMQCSSGWSYEIWCQKRGKERYLEEGWEYMLMDMQFPSDCLLFFNYLGKSEFIVDGIIGCGTNFEYTRHTLYPSEGSQEVDVWVATVTPYMVQHNYPLEVPIEAAKKLFLAWQKKMEVMTLTGSIESWDVSWYLSNGHGTRTTMNCRIENGWQQIARDAVYILGDKMRLYRKAGEKFLRVEYMRAGAEKQYI